MISPIFIGDFSDFYRRFQRFFLMIAPILGAITMTISSGYEL